MVCVLSYFHFGNNYATDTNVGSILRKIKGVQHMDNQKIIRAQTEAMRMILAKHEDTAVEVTKGDALSRQLAALASYHMTVALKHHVERYGMPSAVPRSYWRDRECEALRAGFSMLERHRPFTHWPRTQKDLWTKVRRAVIKAGHKKCTSHFAA